MNTMDESATLIVIIGVLVIGAGLFLAAFGVFG